ncbi:acetamidase/formamidase family protein [Acetomicrobium hydrogeniformans]|uniref:Acetamidase/Formamidase family protein n=1 Tax=Acetomicrobium hydrogeniformans ATCC BAA-1850 TaxID=592015 RepID=A0A0T5XF32_9BACT|nr:acetamidase/formamidase family protein [Acetomicrobium hydrogeniformans]KRT36341.1 Acetamidase/Formamidase family protein [Acetomicrobium hydrogeniformans ATCC BAA-1850]
MNCCQKPDVVVSSESTFFSFDPQLPPAATVDQDVLVQIEAKDCFSNQITEEDQLVSEIDFSRINPATGPIYVKGAKKGDALAVTIHKIDLKQKGAIVTIPKEGVLGDMAEEARTVICDIHSDQLKFKHLNLALKRMIGVIGVATPENTPTGTPGRHGGNMDATVITEGATVYFPVSCDGALFGLGDLHAVMGDGEVCVAACEIAGNVTVSFKALDKLAPMWPCVETKDWLYIVVSDEDINKAFYEATRLTVRAFEGALDLDWHDAYMLASMAMDLEICQLVDPRKTVRAKLPKNLISIDLLLKAIRV